MKYRLPLLLGLSVSLGICAGMASAQSLEDALAAAYANNPELAAGRAALRATDEQVPQALSNWRPTVSVSGSVGASAVRNPKATGTAKGQHRDPRSAAFSVAQPLYRGGRTVAATKEAFNNIRAARASLVSTQQGVLQGAVNAYVSVVTDQAVLELNINNEQVLQRQLEAVQDRFQVGEVTRTDVHQAEARLSGAVADRIQAEGNLEVSRAEYRRIIGESPGALSAPEVPTDLPASAEATFEAAATGNPAIVAAQFRERASLDNVDEIRGELLPSLSLTAKASKSYEASSETSVSTTYSATVDLSVPIYQSGSVYSRLRAAKQTASEKREAVAEARRTAVKEATSAWETMLAAQAAIKAFQTQVTANEVALDGVQREAAVGSRTVLDVLDAEQELLDSRVRLVRAERDLLVAVFELKAAIGDLTAEKLNLPVDYYDPERHYREVRGMWFGGTSSGEGGTSP